MTARNRNTMQMLSLITLST